MSNATDAAAKAAAKSRRGVTARVNDTDRAVAVAALLAALPHLTEGLSEVIRDHAAEFDGEKWVCVTERTAISNKVFVEPEELEQHLAAAVSAHLEKAIKE